MGLLLSVLVTCVGVIELLTFYHNIKRRVKYTPVQSDLAYVHEHYLQDLEGLRDRLAQQLEELKKNEEVIPVRSTAPTIRFNSHEDINVQLNEKVVSRSRSSSPRRFLVSEKNGCSPRRPFVVAEEPQELQFGIKKSRARECLPEYLLEEQKQSDIPQFVLKNGNESVPLPLPKHFLVSELGHEVVTDVFKKKNHTLVDVDGELYFRRSSSPFPSYNHTAPRSSICSELLDNAVSVAEVDEMSRSNSHSPVNACASYVFYNCNEVNNNSEKVEMILSSTSHNSTEYWNNKALVVPSKKSKSRSPSPALSNQQTGKRLSKLTLQRRRSKSESNSFDFTSNISAMAKTSSNLEISEERESAGSLSDEDEEVIEVRIYNEQMKNSLDGVDKSKGCIKKKFVKRKRIKNRPLGNISDYSNDDTKILKSENTFNQTSSSQGSKSVSEPDSCSKKPEPFWLIFSGEFTKAMNKDWHGQHFCCWQCDESLTGQRYVLRDDHPYCVSCYESVFANACEKCSRTIGIDSKDLSYKDKHWHEACFLCTTCNESLVDKQFGSKGDRIYCGRCYDEQFASRCDGCHEIFRAGELI